MSSADLRRNTLHHFTLSTNYHGEDATITRRDGSTLPIRVKVTHKQVGNTTSSTQAGNRPSNSQDEKERIEVLCSRDSTWEFGGLDQKPDIGDQFRRSETRDKDRRPFQFAGEVVFEGDVHAVYAFERARQFVRGSGR